MKVRRLTDNTGKSGMEFEGTPEEIAEFVKRMDSG